MPSATDSCLSRYILRLNRRMTALNPQDCIYAYWFVRTDALSLRGSFALKRGPVCYRYYEQHRARYMLMPQPSRLTFRHSVQS